MKCALSSALRNKIIVITSIRQLHQSDRAQIHVTRTISSAPTYSSEKKKKKREGKEKGKKKNIKRKVLGK